NCGPNWQSAPCAAEGAGSTEEVGSMEEQEQKRHAYISSLKGPGFWGEKSGSLWFKLLCCCLRRSWRRACCRIEERKNRRSFEFRPDLQGDSRLQRNHVAAAAHRRD